MIILLEIILCLLIICIIVGPFVCNAYEKKLYNNGICQHCGQKLRYFTTDSQGGRGYICDKCDYCVWIGGWADKK